MATIAVLGAGGLTGRRLVATLGGHGHELVAVPAATTEPATALQAVGLVVIAVRDPEQRRRWSAAAVRAGTHAIDAGADPDVSLEAYAGLDVPARAAGVVVVPSAGPAVGDLLAAIAATAVQRPTEVHVCWSFPDRGGWRRALAPGFRAQAADLLAAPMPVLFDGRPTHERAGESRRLAWFPRPIGPAHAAAVPGPDPVAVPRHAPGVGLVRTYLAVSTWRAELLQATGSAVRTPRLRAFVTRRWEQGADPVAGDDGARWACVAESRGADGVARAWAYGRDAVELGVQSVATLVDAILTGQCDAGVIPPALVGVPASLLDQLSVRTGLRWSVARPAAGASGQREEGADGR